MKYIKIKLRSRSYSAIENNNESFGILGNFLTDDVGYSKDDAEGWIEYINNPAYDSTTSNYSFMDKEDGKLILGREVDLLGDDWEKAYEQALELSPQQLIDVLNTWYELCSRKPEEIIITQDDNNNITLEGRNFPTQ